MNRNLNSMPSKAFAAILVFMLSSVLIGLIWRAGFATPFSDELVFEQLYAALAANHFPPLADLVAAHNGHPYLIVKLLFAITLLSGLPWVWLMYAQVGLLALAAAVAVGRGTNVNAPLAAVVCAIAVLTPRQWENLYWAMQIAFPLFLAAALTAFVAADRYANTADDPSAWAALALGSGLVASVSNGAGIFALGLTCLAIFFARPDWRIRSVAVAVGLAGVALFAAAQALAPRSGIGERPIDWLRAAEHALRMVGHQFVDRPAGSLVPLALGGLAAIVVLGVIVRALKSWRGVLFEILCIALSLALIAGVTYSRVSAGIFQPDAPRYIPLIVPLTIGTVLLLARIGYRWLVAAFFVGVSVGYALSLHDEWGVAPYRKAALADSHRALCQTGRVHPLHNMGEFVLRGGAPTAIKELFCKDEPVAARSVDHGSILSSGVTGYYREESHTWAGPLLSVPVPKGPDRWTVTIQGWLPDSESYLDGKFIIEVLTDGVVVETREITTAGAFSVEADVPSTAALLEVRSPARVRVGADLRDLSWVLVSVVFR